MSVRLPPRCAELFRPVRHLASGGYGDVVLATQVGLDRPVVIKLLHAHGLANEAEVARFVNEALVTASLKHPNIVVLIDHAVEDGLPWIAYEYLKGADLRQRLEAGAFEVARAVRTVAQVSGALAEAHRRGILHRDIKPENVIETSPLTCKVMDFGIAKWASASVKTATGVILGTPAYIAPEQVLGAPASEASDVYAAGVLLYELLSATRPFDGDNIGRVLEAHVRQPVPRLRDRATGVSLALERLVERTLAKQPGDRPTAAQLEEALRPFESDAPAPAQSGPRSVIRRSGTVAATKPSGPRSVPLTAAIPARASRAPMLGAGALAAVALIAALGIGRAWAPTPAPTPAPIVVVTTPAAPSPASPSPSPRPPVVRTHAPRNDAPWGTVLLYARRCREAARERGPGLGLAQSACEWYFETLKRARPAHAPGKDLAVIRKELREALVAAHDEVGVQAALLARMKDSGPRPPVDVQFMYLETLAEVRRNYPLDAPAAALLEETRVELRKILEREPAFEEARQLLAEVEGALAIHATHELANKALRDGDFEGAKRHARAALLLRKHCALFAVLAEAELQNKEYAQAERDFVQAIAESGSGCDDYRAQLSKARLGLAQAEARDHPERAEALYRLILEAFPDHYDAQRGLAGRLIARGRLEEAIAVDRRLLNHMPNADNARLELAQLVAKTATPLAGARVLFDHWKADPARLPEAMAALEIAGDQATRIALLREAVGVDPKAKWAWEMLDDLLQRSGKLAEAAAAIAKHVEADPLDGPLREHQSIALERLAGHGAQGAALAPAVRAQREAVRLLPGDPGPLRRLGALLVYANQDAEALPVLRAADALAPDDLATISILGDIFERAENMTEALVYRQRARKRAPQAPAPCNAEAHVHLRLRQEKEAEECYRDALRLAPANREAGYNLAQLLAARPAVPAAITVLEGVVARDVKWLEGAVLLASLLRRAGRVDEIGPLLHRYQEASPADRQALLQFASIYGEAGRHTDAVRLCQTALEAPNAPPNAQAQLGNALLDDHRPGEAAALLAREIPGQERGYGLHLAYGKALLFTGYAAQADVEFLAAIAANPALAEALCLLAEARMPTQGAAKVLPLLQKAVGLDRDVSWSHAALAQCLEKLGRTEEAAAEYREVLRLLPTDAESRRHLEALQAPRAPASPR